jgi:hypothetical protein
VLFGLGLLFFVAGIFVIPGTLWEFLFGSLRGEPIWLLILFFLAGPFFLWAGWSTLRVTIKGSDKEVEGENLSF